MIDNDLSLFETPDSEAEPDGEPPEPKVESVAEVFELARKIFRTSGPADEPPETPALARARARREEKAGERGLVARWGDYKKAKGHVSIHDPSTGRWHDLPWKDAPGWAQREALKRSSLYRSSGDARGFDFTAKHMHEIWEEEHPAEAELVEEGIIEEYELPD